MATRSHPDDSAVLAAAAFGDRWGSAETTPVLPQPGSALDSWHRAVALGALGYYARARAELERTRRWPGVGAAMVSLSTSTEASLLRQLGRHRHAAELDGAALALVTDTGAASAASKTAASTTAARCDARTGAAADALGIGRFALARRHLDRCATELSAASHPAGDFPRQRLRLLWVEAELAMAAGSPERAVEFADAAAACSAELPSVRHGVKTDLIVAASRCVAGHLEAALQMSADVLQRCDDHGFLPLQWAAAMLRNGIAADAEAGRTAAACKREIERRGGVFERD